MTAQEILRARGSGTESPPIAIGAVAISLTASNVTFPLPGGSDIPLGMWIGGTGSVMLKGLDGNFFSITVPGNVSLNMPFTELGGNATTTATGLVAYF